MLKAFPVTLVPYTWTGQPAALGPILRLISVQGEQTGTPLLTNAFPSVQENLLVT